MPPSNQERIEILTLTKMLLTRYFTYNDIQPALELFAEDILWLGGCQHMIAVSKAEAEAIYEAGMKDMRPCRMLEEEYYANEIAPGIWTGLGISWLETNPDDLVCLSDQQRTTFVFRKIKGAPEGRKWEITHLHTSIAYRGTQENEFFALKLGNKNYKSWKYYKEPVIQGQAKQQLYYTFSNRFERLPLLYRHALTDLSLFENFSVQQALFVCPELAKEVEDFIRICRELPFMLYGFEDNRFHFHAFFQDFLQHQFDNYPKKKQNQIKQRTIDCLLEEGRSREAFDLARSIKDWRRILRASDQGSLDLLQQYALDDILLLLRTMPDTVRLKHMDSCFRVVLHILLNLEPMAAVDIWDTFCTDLPDTFKPDAYGEMTMNLLQAVCLAPNLKRMFHYCQKAEKLYKKAGKKLPREYFYGIARAIGGPMNVYDRVEGQLASNRDQLKELYDCCASFIEDVDALNWKEAADGEYAYLTGNFELAEVIFSKLLFRDYQSRDDIHLACVAFSLLPAVSLVKGNRDNYRMAMDMYPVLKERIIHPQWKTALELLNLYTHCMIIDSVTWAENEFKNLASLPRYVIQHPLYRIVRHLLLLKMKRPLALAMECRQEELSFSSMSGYSSRRSRIEEGILLAVAEYLIGNRKKAETLIRDQLKSAQFDQAIMPFVMYRSQIEPLLEKLSSSPEFTVFIEKIRGYSMEKDSYRQPVSVSLTPRETTIIDCIMLGMSNRDIARQLMLAEVTVKKNISRIFRKYNVHSRTGLLHALQMEGKHK